MKKHNIRVVSLLALVAMLGGCGTKESTSSSASGDDKTSDSGSVSRDYDNSIEGITNFLNDAADADNYTVSYYYEDEEYVFQYDKNYVYGSYIDGGYIVVDNFFDDTTGALFAFTNNKDEKSVDLGNIYAVSNNGKVSYPDSTLYVNPLKYYIYGDYIGEFVQESYFTMENGEIISTDKTFIYYIAALSGYQSYVSDGDSPAISFKYTNNTIVCNMMAYEEDGVTLSDVQGADFVIHDVGTTHFTNGDNYIKNSSKDFGGKASLTEASCPSLLSQKWSLDISRSTVNSDGTTSLSGKVEYDFDNFSDKKGVSYKLYDKNDVLTYTLCYQIDEQGLYSSSINNMNEVVKEYYSENISAFLAFQSHFEPYLWKKSSATTYTYHGLDAATIIYDLTMWDMSSYQIEYLKANYENQDGVDVVTSFTASLYTPTYTLDGAVVDEKRELVEIKINNPARDIDSSLGEKLPDNVEGVTDRLKTAIDRYNDDTKSYKVHINRYDALKKYTYQTTDQTFMKDYYVSKKTTYNENNEGTTVYRGMKMVDDGVIYFSVINGKVTATSSVSKHDTAMNQREYWQCSPAVYDKQEGSDDVFLPNGNVKLIPDNMPIHLLDNPSDLKVTLYGEGTGAVQNYLKSITYRVSTFAGYIVDDYTYTYDWGTDGNGVTLDSDIASQVEALTALKDEELPKSWSDDKTDGLIATFKQNGFTDAQIAAIPYLYSPALSGNYKTFNMGYLNVCSDGDINQTTETQQQWQTDYITLLESDEMKALGWVRAAGNDELPVYKNANLEISVQVGSTADYGLNLFPYLVSTTDE